MKSAAQTFLAPNTLASLQKLGADLRDARRRQQITLKILADRMQVSRAACARMERAYPTVQLALYALALQTLGFAPRFDELADVRFDNCGLARARTCLPQRVRLHRATIDAPIQA